VPQIHLHPDLSGMPLWRRGALAICAALGVVGQVFVSIAMSVEVLTTVSPSPWRFWVLVPAAFSVWHVFRELPAYGRLPAGRWTAFWVAAISPSVNAWTTIADPTASMFFAATGAGSALLIWIARLIARDARLPSDDDKPG
jgi:hypothetical protein